MDKQTTVAFILIGVVLVAWLYLNAPDPSEQNKLNTFPDSTIVQQKPVVEEPALVEPTLKTKEVPAAFASEVKQPESIITLETDLSIIELTSKGGKLKKIYLKNYKTWYVSKIPEDGSFYDKHVQLINQKDGGDLNIIFVSKNGDYVNTGDLDFKSSYKNYYKKIEGDESFSITYSYENKEGNGIKKTFVFNANKYALDFAVELINLNNTISSYRYDVVWANGINFVEVNSVDEARYSSASAYSGDEQVEIDASSVGEKINKDINGLVDWVGLKNKYFTVIFSALHPSPDGGAYFDGEHILDPTYGEREYYSASLKVPFKDASYQKDEFQMYIGPLEYDSLQSYGKNYEKMFDFGDFMGLDIFQPISEYVLLPLFKFLHKFIPNYGFVIIVFSIIIKFALYPLTKQSFKSMKRMQMLQPKITEMKEKYKDEPQRVQKETMKLYSTYGINPAGGCLPMLLQMPILFALFTMFNVAIELRSQPFIWWITNLAAPDVIWNLPFTIPLFGVNQITGLAPLLGVSMFLQQKMTVKDPSQKAMVYLMPVMFTVMFMGFASGLNLYYLMFNIFSVLQQQYINKFGKEEPLVPVKKGEKKGGGFMQRMMDAAENQKQSQQKSQKKNKH